MMSRNNQSGDSPYSTPIQQYPSQSSDYLSLDINSSRIQQQQPQYQRQQQQPYNQQRNNTNYGAFRSRRGGGRFGGGGQNRYFDETNNDNNGASGAGRGNNYYHTNYARDLQQHQQLNRWAHGRGGNFGTGRGGRGGRTTHRPTIGKDEMYVMYFHPSMLEDPWKQLMERHNAIHNSEINLQSSSETDDGPKEQKDARNSSDNDQNINEPADDNI